MEFFSLCSLFLHCVSTMFSIYVVSLLCHLEMVKDRFRILDLLSPLEDTLFSQFFTTLKDDEIIFKFGKEPCRFGQLAYALITGMSMLDGPGSEEEKQHLTSHRLVSEYFLEVDLNELYSFGV